MMIWQRRQRQLHSRTHSSDQVCMLSEAALAASWHSHSSVQAGLAHTLPLWQPCVLGQTSWELVRPCFQCMLPYPTGQGCSP